jgi:hypothetical protein
MKKLAICMLAIGILLVQSGYAFELVTAAEVSASKAASPMQEAEFAPVDPKGPVIQVVDPQSLDVPLKNPFKMEVSFKPQQGETLDLTSFKALYGFLKLDITDRLLKEAIKTPTGIKLANVDVPSGRHKLLLSIKDSQGHFSAKEIIFKVE